MPTYQIELPTGEKYQVESPAELTDQQAFLAAQQQMPKAQGNVQTMNKTSALEAKEGVLKAPSKWDEFVNSPLMQKIIGQPSFIREAKEQFGAPISSPVDLIADAFTKGPKIPQSTDSDNAVVAQEFGKPGQAIIGIGNVFKNLANSFLTPGGVATVGVGGGLGRALAGGFAVNQAIDLPQEAKKAGTVLGNNQSTLQQKIEAVGNPVASTLMTVDAGSHALKGEPLAKGVQEVKQTPELKAVTKPLADSIYKPNLPEYKQVDPSKPRNIPPQTKTDEQKQQGREMVLTGPWLARNAREEIGLDTSKASPEQTMNRLNNLTTTGKLSSTELQIYKDQGLEDFVKAKPTPEKLAEWMQEKGPRVVIDKAGFRQQTPEQKELATLTHNWVDQLPTAQYNSLVDWADGEVKEHVLKPWLEESDKEKAKRFKELREIVARQPVTHGRGSNWQSISPKPENEMPGYVEGAVTVPVKGGWNVRNPRTGIEEYENGSGNEKFPSSHSFPPNTLGFFRGYMEGDTFHVIEVQSDWAQRVREDEARFKEHVARGRAVDTDLGRAGYSDFVTKKGQDPLIKDYERLTLKAAIQHAIGEGAKHIAISDAETAMMTEGHDRQDPIVEHAQFEHPQAAENYLKHNEYILGRGGRVVENPKGIYKVITGGSLRQEKGMRLHYDQILPKLLKELTGSEGVEKEFGEHRMAMRNDYIPRPNTMDEPGRLPRKDLIFKDKSGEPKTTITAKSFDLSKAKERQAFSLFDKDKVPAQAKQAAPSTDVDERLQKHWTARLGLDKPSTVGDVMRRIVKDGSTYSEGTVSLAKLLDDHFSHVIDSAAVAAGKSPTGNRASYVPDEHKVYLDIGGRESGNVIGTVLHEGAHAAFHWLVETEPKVREQVSKIREQVLKALPKGVQEFYNKTYLPGVLKKAENLTGKDITSWFNEAGLDTKKWHETLYALQDNSEFIANIFNSKNFRDFLNEIPAESSSLWAKVKAFIAQSLGIKPGTVLDKTFDTLLEGRDLYKDEKNLPDAIVAARDLQRVSKARGIPPMPSEEGGEPAEDVIWLGNQMFADARGPKGFRETVDQKLNQIAGWSAPKTMASSREAGNALVRYASARIAAPLIAKATTSEVAGSHWNDEPWMQKFGAALTEDRLRAIRQSFVEQGKPEDAARVKHIWMQDNSPFKTDAEFKAFLNEPDTKAALARFDKLIQQPTTERQKQLGGKIAKSGIESGAFVNLIALQGEQARDLALSGGSRAGDLTNPLKRGSVFNRQAKGTAEQYDFNFRNIAERMIRGNYEEGTKRDLYDAYVKSGLAVLVKSGEERPAELGGLPTQKITIDKGRGQKEDLWVRSDVAHELRQALQTDSPVERGARQWLLNALTDVQLVGPVDVTVHLRNMFSAIAGSQGGESLAYDLARKIPGVRGLDALVRLTMATKDAIVQTPEVQKELAEIAKVGGGRGQVEYHGVVAKVLPTGKLVQLMDKAGRLTLSRMYDNLVDRGMVDKTEEGRREFVNKMGQYNSRLRGKITQMAKEYGVSPFVVAGKNFNRLALQRLTMNPGVEAANPQAALKMRLVEAAGLTATLLALPMVVNYYTTGSVWGRPGVKAGAIDTGKNDKKGRPVEIDLVQNVLVRRGLRNIGEEAAYKDMKQGKALTDILQDSFYDMVRGFAAPYEGPAVRFAKTALTGYDTSGYLQSENPDSLGENLKAALQSANPSIAKYFQAKEEETSKILGLAQPVLQATGVGVGRKPSLSEEELAQPNIGQKSLADRAVLQQSLTHKENDLTSKQRLEMSLAEARQSKALESQVNHDLSKETQDWLKRNNLKVPGFAEYLEQTGVKVYLLPKEREAYEKIMVQSYEEQLAKAKQVVDREPTKEMKQKVVDRFIKAAHGIARNRMRNMIGHIDE